MTQATCAYCKSVDTLTREHLWPASLHRRLLNANNQAENLFWLARLNKEIPSEPQIRDVCAKCNNVVLSELDQYICDLFDSTLARTLEKDEQITFEHDYHLLKRWLLKLCFNSARIHNSPDRSALELMLPYILGHNISLGRSVQLFVQLTYPEAIPEQDINDNAPAERPLMFKPLMNRVGHMHFRVPGVGEKLLRAIHLRSYTFFLAFYKPDEARSVLDDFTYHFCTYAKTTLLRPSCRRVELQCNGMGAWESFKGSRDNKFVFSSGV